MVIVAQIKIIGTELGLSSEVSFVDLKKWLKLFNTFSLFSFLLSSLFAILTKKDFKMLFFTSDTHFNDSKIIKQYGRAFSDVESMNTTLISNWNALFPLKMKYTF